jgi:hypothetical protein
MRGRRIILLAAACLLGVLSVAQAQTAPGGQTPRRAPRSIDLAFGGAFGGPTDFGSRSEELLRPDGSTLVLFRTENRQAAGPGLEAHLGFGVSPRLWIEASGAWMAGDFESRITDDIEDADDVTVSESVSRFTVEGAVRWQVWSRGRTQLFARGSVGWMRDVAGDSALVGDGTVATAGVSLRHWFRERRAGLRTRRIGWRADGRIQFRDDGLTLGDDTLRFTPMAFGGIVFGF